MGHSAREEAKEIYAIYARIKKEKSFNRDECYSFCEVMQQHGYTPVYSGLMYQMIQVTREAHKKDIADQLVDLFE